MNKGFRLFPEQASTLASQVDYLYLFLVVVSIFFALLIFFLIYIFAVKYRRRSEDDIPKEIPGLLKLELVWAGVPLVLCMVVFAWGVGRLAQDRGRRTCDLMRAAFSASAIGVGAIWFVG